VAICQIMISDFMHHTGRLHLKGDGTKVQMYDIYDLEVGLQYAIDLLEDGITKEPYHEYDVKEFKRWCEHKLCKLKGVSSLTFKK